MPRRDYTKASDDGEGLTSFRLSEKCSQDRKFFVQVFGDNRAICSSWRDFLRLLISLRARGSWPCYLVGQFRSSPITHTL